MKSFVMISSFLSVFIFVTAKAAEVTPSFATLKTAFDGAKPAKITDYPRIGDFSKPTFDLQCVAVTMKLPAGILSELTPVVIGRFRYTAPGKPRKVMTTLSAGFALKDEPVSEQNIVDLYKAMNATLPQISTSASGDLQGSFKTSGSPNYFYQGTYRKSGSELHFHEEFAAPSMKPYESRETYGYCYRVSK